MLKFFRSIRRNLVHEGSLKKYLVYAVGEILLVLIGILLALQINGWNNKRKDQLEKTFLLYQLKKDIEMDMSWYQQQDSIITDYIPKLDTALMLFYQAKELKDFAAIGPYIGMKPNDFSFNDDTYEEMINTGKLYLIEEEKLKNAITNYYKRAERARFYLRTFFEKNLDIGSDVEILPLNRLASPVSPPPDLLDTSWIGNPQSRTFISAERLLHFRRDMVLLSTQEQYLQLLDLAKGLLALMNEELTVK